MIFNPYLVFDVPMSADFETLRATYRRLARENHPDVASDKARATERMAQINRAWGILGDVQKRAEWDGEWRRHSAEEARREALRREALRREAAHRESLQREALLREALRPRRAPVAPSKTTSRARETSASASSARPSAKRGAGGTSRGGLSATATRNGSARRAGSNETHFPDSASPQTLRLMRKITLAARVFHRDGNAKSAIEMCRAVLLADGRNVPARELLSEIFASQGRLEIAVMMLDQAIQLAPDDLFLRRKRNHLENARFPGGALRPVKRPGLWQRLRAQFKKGR